MWGGGPESNYVSLRPGIFNRASIEQIQLHVIEHRKLKNHLWLEIKMKSYFSGRSLVNLPVVSHPFLLAWIIWNHSQEYVTLIKNLPTLVPRGTGALSSITWAFSFLGYMALFNTKCLWVIAQIYNWVFLHKSPLHWIWESALFSTQVYHYTRRGIQYNSSYSSNVMDSWTFCITKNDEMLSSSRNSHYNERVRDLGRIPNCIQEVYYIFVRNGMLDCFWPKS